MSTQPPFNPTMFNAQIDELKASLSRYEVEYKLMTVNDLDAMFEAFGRIEDDLDDYLIIFNNIDAEEHENGHEVTVEVLTDAPVDRFAEGTTVEELEY